MDPEAIIDMHNIRKSFGDVTAVDGIDLRVTLGEMFGLVGPDGAGKSTIIRILCGLEPAESGSGTVLGLDFPAEIEKVKRRIGYLSQRFSLYTDLTVQENIEFFAEIHGVEGYRTRMDFLLDVTGLGRFRKRLADNLSGGMKQKMALACTLIHKPDLVYLDEPTVGVDPVSRRDFWSILSELVGTDLTIVISTPYLDEAERCSRLALVNNGRVMLEGTPDYVRKQMVGEIVEVVCEESRKASRVLAGLSGVTETQLFGDRVIAIVKSWDRESEAIQAALRANNLETISIRKIQPSIENVFVSMLKSEMRAAG